MSTHPQVAPATARTVYTLRNCKVQVPKGEAKLLSEIQRVTGAILELRKAADDTEHPEITFDSDTVPQGLIITIYGPEDRSSKHYAVISKLKGYFQPQSTTKTFG